MRASWFRLVRFRSPLLTESMSFSFPPVTKMFQFTGFPPFRVRTVHSAWVPPFGNPWIKAYLRLPKAYRRWSRPSSVRVPGHPPCALNNLTIKMSNQFFFTYKLRKPIKLKLVGSSSKTLDSYHHLVKELTCLSAFPCGGRSRRRR
jgi:hypothetical protein